jgi:hypothetical protein
MAGEQTARDESVKLLSGMLIFNGAAFSSFM